MRLSSLKLSGFKSFADSSTLSFRANRTAVVGPNGCGKSNVIDAIRWVMGESSARQLRGGSMQDVIFTGTSKRKPVGMASVELRFDNTYGKLGGSYNAYTELAVRRQVTRDGKSEYFLNGSKCRRRDITDIFLGTGLGPRSYAIIEQGMINRLVDAKPDEMRVFIEEAAGVSRYQARRKETLQHLEHTSLNLERLEDISSELKSQLKTLKRQSESAVQYKTLETEIRSLKIDILSFQCEQSTRLQEQYSVQMNELGEQFKLVRSEMTTVEHDLSSTSELFQRLIQQSMPLQQEWQQAEKKQAELKLTLEQKQNLLQHNTQNLLQLNEQKQQCKEKIQLIELQLESLHDQLEQQTEQLEQHESSTQHGQKHVHEMSQQQSQLQQQFDQQRSLIEKQRQQQQQMQSQSEYLVKNIQRIEQQKETLQIQLQQIQGQTTSTDIEHLQQEQHDQRAAIDVLEQKVKTETQHLEQLQQAYSQHKNTITERQAEIQVLQSEQKTIQKLLVKNNTKAASEQQLLQHLQLTEPAKAHANIIEKFLARWLEASCLDEKNVFQHNIARQMKTTESGFSDRWQDLCSLSQWIKAPQSSLWQKVYVAESLEQALALQSQLQQGQSILSLDGYHLGSDWMIALLYDESSQAAQGALSHRIRLEQIEVELAQLVATHTIEQQQLPELEQAKQHVQQQLQQDQQQLKQKLQQLQQLDVELVKHQSATQAFQLQRQQLQDQLQQLDAQLEEDAMQKDDLEIDLHALIFKLEQSLPEFEALQAKLDKLNVQADEQRQVLQQQQQELETTRRVAGQNQQQVELLEKDLSFTQQQRQQIVFQIEQAQTCVEPIQLELPSLKSQFDEQSQQTEKLQETWQNWQTELHQVQEKQQQLTVKRHEQQQLDEKLRTELEAQRLAWQAAKSDLQHYSEQLTELEAKLKTGLTIDLEAHQKKLALAQQQFSKLGAVNLAASEEYVEISARAEQLNLQIEDLQTTVTQLKDAMKSIDLETKKLFMTTFDQINLELQNLFPKVFNGGEASLSLEDDWQSGVRLMARPPGKRNSSLALLSGGEKALTALALVFAIFRLNPAPFCVLDEVDAPLDDANVGRFCNLVKELSEQVQFIYITHNKVAMTMATDLLGVTMPEPGASKLVSVNLEEAKEYGLVAES
ncbi:chromosome segregation protein SMC [Acinetobacter rudis]|uniref:chromosome segregation protein SMC n=1 Tax=Acinetobacter rudis TaxID=632955 RepID=UPI00333E9A37